MTTMNPVLTPEKRDEIRARFRAQAERNLDDMLRAQMKPGMVFHPWSVAYVADGGVVLIKLIVPEQSA